MRVWGFTGGVDGFRARKFFEASLKVRGFSPKWTALGNFLVLLTTHYSYLRLTTTTTTYYYLLKLRGTRLGLSYVRALRAG